MQKLRLLILLLLQIILFAQAEQDIPWFAGAASRSVLPPVNGRTDYFQPSPDPLDCCSPGFAVPKFDHGNIAVGNGHFSGKWVRDDLRASVLCIRHGPKALDKGRETLVLVSADVYMLFRQDIQAVYDLVEEQLAPEEYELLKWSVSATHNHHGPDTAGMGLPVNHDHYQWMAEQIAAAVLEAYSGMQEVKLEYGRRARWMFGLGDHKDPLIIDPELHVLQAKLKTGRPLATLVQWTCHPETTLFFSPETPAEDCKKIGEEPGCSSNGRYLSSDFPGHLRSTLQEAYGEDHTVLYMNGAIGVQIGPHGPVWEVSSEFPVTGDGSKAPAGAPMIEKNFRRTYMIGLQLGKAVLGVLENRNQREFLFRGTNLKFRMAMSPASAIGGDPNLPAIMGHRLRRGYICEPLSLEEKAEVLQMAEEDRPLGWMQDMKCVDDQFDVEHHYNPKFLLPLPARKANFLKTEVNLIDFGWVNPDGSARGRPELRILSIPAELCPEMVSGVPQDFDDPNSVSKYYRDPTRHVLGKEYEFPGFLQAMMSCNKTCLSADSDSKGHPGETCTHCWYFGLTQDELGYVFPISDWRIGCLDAFNQTFCDSADLTYPGDSMSGEACEVLIPYGNLESKEELKEVLDLLKRRIPGGEDSPSTRAFTQLSPELSFPISERLFRSLRPESLTIQKWNAQLEVCKWGQFGEAKGHYEETNAAGWGLNRVYVEEVGRLLGGVKPFGRYALPADP